MIIVGAPSRTLNASTEASGVTFLPVLTSKASRARSRRSLITVDLTGDANTALRLATARVRPRRTVRTLRRRIRVFVCCPRRAELAPCGTKRRILTRLTLLTRRHIGTTRCRGKQTRWTALTCADVPSLRVLSRDTVDAFGRRIGVEIGGAVDAGGAQPDRTCHTARGVLPSHTRNAWCLGVTVIVV